MDGGAGSPAPDGNRLHVDEANYSPSRSPPLLQSVSGNDSSSGSPSGSRRHGSTGEKDKKNREERLKLMKERQEQQHERRLAELKAAYEKETRIRQLKDAERLRRIQEIKMKEAQRRQGVEERRRRLETEDKEKREQILAKYKEYEHRLIIQRDQKKPVYAFGSSTPRTLTYLEHMDNSMRVYNSRLNSATGGDDDSTTSTTKGAISSAEKRATSACSLTRKPLTASSSPNLSPLHHRAKLTNSVHHHQHHQHHQQPSHPPVTSRTTKNILAPSGRWGGSMVASMYGGSTALSTANAHPNVGHHNERDPLANISSMTTSFAVGETSAASNLKNVRTKGPLNSSPASARSQSTTRLARTTTATQRKTRQQDVITEENEDGADIMLKPSENQRSINKRNGSDGGGEGAPTAAVTNQKAKGVSSSRTPSAPPPAIRRQIDTTSKNIVAATTSKATATKEKPKPAVASKAMHQKPPTQHHQQQHTVVDTEVVKIIRKPKASETSTPERSALVSPSIEHGVENTSGISPDTSLDISLDHSMAPVSSNTEDITMVTVVDSIRLDEDNLCQFEENQHHDMVDQAPLEPDTHIRDEVHVHGNGDQPMISIDQELLSVTQDINLLASSIENLDLTSSMMSESASNVPKPTGQSAGKVLSKEEATAALAERRRLAREQMEREKELERQKEEQRILEEEEMRRREEEEFRRQEEEELRMLEEARRVEAERMRKMIEEEEKRREEENKQREEEQRKKLEAESRAREEAERSEKEKKEAEEKFKKDELERSERKKRLDAIMQRTRQAGGAPSTPISKQQQQGGSGQIFVNGGGSDHGHNDSIYMTPADKMNDSIIQTPHHSASASVLKKLANANPEMGRSLENILNRVKSTPNVNEGDHHHTAMTTANESLMTTSFSADKVGQTPATNQRMTQSFYQTPAEHFGGKSFNYSSVGGGGLDSDYDRTEYDIDADATKSESFYAAKVPLLDLTANDGHGQHQTAVVGIVDRNANNSNIVTALDFSHTGEINNFFDHNDNMNGGAGTNGHHGSQRTESSETTTTVVHHQKIVSPHDIQLDDPFSSPSKTNRTFDDLINDNLSTPDGNVVNQTTTKVVQERPLMDF